LYSGALSAGLPVISSTQTGLEAEALGFATRGLKERKVENALVKQKYSTAKAVSALEGADCSSPKSAAGNNWRSGPQGKKENREARGVCGFDSCEEKGSMVESLRSHACRNIPVFGGSRT